MASIPGAMLVPVKASECSTSSGMGEAVDDPMFLQMFELRGQHAGGNLHNGALAKQASFLFCWLQPRESAGPQVNGFAVNTRPAVFIVAEKAAVMATQNAV